MPPAIGKPDVRESASVAAREKRLSEISAIERSAKPGKVDSLKKMLQDPDPLVRGSAVEALGRVKDPAAFTALSGIMKSTDPHARWGAIEGMGRLKDKRAMADLIGLLNHEDRNTRWKAVTALGDMKDQAAVGALSRTAETDKDKNVRLSAIEALMKIGGPAAQAEFSKLSADPDADIKAWASAALKKARGAGK